MFKFDKAKQVAVEANDKADTFIDPWVDRLRDSRWTAPIIVGAGVTAIVAGALIAYAL